jgi:uncharacterized protein (DUF433 family)
LIVSKGVLRSGSLEQISSQKSCYSIGIACGAENPCYVAFASGKACAVKPDFSFIGIGVYTPAEAARLIGVPPSTLQRWLRGYKKGEQEYDPLWRPSLDLGDERTYLTFLDLVQARVAIAFINAGLSPQKVRKAIELGRTILDSTYPFASARLRTDGNTVMLQVLTPGEDDRLIDLFRDGQYLMKHVVEPSLKGLEFDKDLAVRWWPAGKGDRIVIDPRRQFGQPIDAETGVPTSVLATAVTAEGSVENAARAYRVPTAAVRRALRFEQKLAA